MEQRAKICASRDSNRKSSSRSVWSECWDLGTLPTHISCAFNLVVFKISLWSFSAKRPANKNVPQSKTDQKVGHRNTSTTYMGHLCASSVSI